MGLCTQQNIMQQRKVNKRPHTAQVSLGNGTLSGRWKRLHTGETPKPTNRSWVGQCLAGAQAPQRLVMLFLLI